MTDTPQQPSRLDRIEAILATVAEQQATNTQAIAELTDNVTRVLGRSAILDDVLLELRDSHEELKRDFLENQRTTNAALNQLGAILVQLTRIDPQN
jgi:chromosome segregation ATPase